MFSCVLAGKRFNPLNHLLDTLVDLFEGGLLKRFLLRVHVFHLVHVYIVVLHVSDLVEVDFMQ